jgi:hypothetical protein
VRPRAAALIAAAALAGAAAGCGATERAPDAAAVAERFHAALGERDGEAACSDMSEQTANKLEKQAGVPCEQAVLELELPRGGTAAKTSVYVTTASVLLAEGGTTFLDEGSNGWKVSASGCEPTAPDLPYDCQLEG